jgi:endonuclease/exonuclease/phosphatase (EEP) superfamily protein YafD
LQLRNVLKLSFSFLATIVSLCLFGLLSPWLAHFFGEYNQLFWLHDLLVHWQWLYALGLIFGVLLLSIKDKRFAVLLVFLAIPFLSASPSLASGESAKTLIIASANVHVSTKDITQLREWLAAQNPQVVVLLEVSTELGKQLPSLEEYPHQIVEAHDSPFGIALLSQLPILKSEIINNMDDIAHIEADIDFDGKPISVYAFHPMPPIDADYHQSRNAQLSAMATKIQTRKIPAIIAGDFNATPWSSAFRSLNKAGLKRTNLSPTWPNWGYKIIGIPIDHIVASKQWRLNDSQVGKSIGSDHFPVIAKLSLIEKDSP